MSLCGWLSSQPRRSLSAATDGTPPTMEYKASSRGAGDWADYLHRGPVGVDSGLVEEIAGESVEGRTSKRDLAVQQWESPMRWAMFTDLAANVPRVELDMGRWTVQLLVIKYGDAAVAPHRLGAEGYPRIANDALCPPCTYTPKANGDHDLNAGGRLLFGRFATRRDRATTESYVSPDWAGGPPYAPARMSRAAALHPRRALALAEVDSVCHARRR